MGRAGWRVKASSNLLPPVRWWRLFSRAHPLLLNPPCTTQGSPFRYLETLRITVISRGPQRSSKRQTSSLVAPLSRFAPRQHSAAGARISTLLQGRTQRIREAKVFAQGHTAAECEGLRPGFLILRTSSQIELPAALTHPEPYFRLSIYSTHI